MQDCAGPLGLNKLFWVPDSENSIVVAARPHGSSLVDFHSASLGHSRAAGALDVGGAGARYSENPIASRRAGTGWSTDRRSGNCQGHP